MPIRERESRVFLFRIERDLALASALASPATRRGMAVDSGKRHWRASVGDTLIFAGGRGDNAVFLGTAKVRALEFLGETPEAQTILVFDHYEPFAHKPQLSDFMYSLVTVANFSRPWLNLPHRRMIPNDDLETLRRNRVEKGRSVYFALLRHLPDSWRLQFDAEATARTVASASSARFPTAHGYAERARNLMELLEWSAVLPFQLASEVGKIHQDSLTDVIPRLEGALEGVRVGWEMAGLLGYSQRNWEQAKEVWDEVIATLPGSSDFAEEAMPSWRPHRW